MVTYFKCNDTLSFVASSFATNPTVTRHFLCPAFFVSNYFFPTQFTVSNTQFFGNPFPVIFLHVFAVKVVVTFVKDNRIFLNCEKIILFITCHFVFDLSIRDAIEQYSQLNAVQMCLGSIFLFFSFSSVTLFSCEKKSLLVRKCYANTYERRKVLRKTHASDHI